MTHLFNRELYKQVAWDTNEIRYVILYFWNINNLIR